MAVGGVLTYFSVQLAQFVRLKREDERAMEADMRNQREVLTLSAKLVMDWNICTSDFCLLFSVRWLRIAELH